jgi:hypothetical protein
MAFVGASEAARLIGKNRAQIYRALKSGAMSATKDELGATVIDTSELFRVFPKMSSTNTENTTGNVAPNNVQRAANSPEHADLSALLAAEREKSALLMDTVTDLRQRLDQEGEERRKAQTQLTALLTDQRQKPLPAEPMPPPRGWVGLVAVLGVVAGAVGGAWWVLMHPQLLP